MNDPLDASHAEASPSNLQANPVALLVAQAAASYAAGDLAEAGRAAQAALHHQPDEPDALNILGVVAASRGDAARAVKLLQESARLHGEPGPIHGNLAMTLRMLGRSREAVAHAREAVRLRPDNPVN